MKNKSLELDYISRSEHRLCALEVLYERKSWADVVREAQEIVELALKALLRHSGIEVPRVHDVGSLLAQHRDRLPGLLTDEEIGRIAGISKNLRRDRELAFYGSEDLTPSEFYSEPDALAAKRDAAWVVERVKAACSPPLSA
ncbi:MAG: hypothetical protein A2583_01505 [Bdellovibrionales bacterium RIFOXYD1_FULL_53_11]|nr:MAG: hypothetical protein A2583_01505 [Bdellovibrionales bacterium RIFOXYD1_FULL_53_11]